MSPPIPLPLILPLLALVAAAVLWWSWRGTGGLPIRKRTLLLTLRGLGLLLLSLILLNPGRWVRPTSESSRPWLVLLDRSASMARPLDGSTRADASARLAADTARQASDVGLPARILPFDSALAPESTPATPPPAKGDATHIINSTDAALRQSAATGESPAALLILSDGRSTALPDPASLDSLILRARSLGCPIHAVALGEGEPQPDLALRPVRPLITAFADQPLHISIAVKSTGLDPVRPTLTLRDSAGQPLGELAIDCPPDKTIVATFDIPAPDASDTWTIDTPTLPGEVRSGNNRATVHIRLITSKTRVFLAEGAPYWDSKFLAQLLRQQPHMDVHSVHRLSEKRYFRIDSGQAVPTETSDSAFPADLDALSRYDLIVFGKNVDAFLDESRATALRAYVRDRGGAVLFSRGKPTTARLAGLDPLEPVEWAATTASTFRLAPTHDGEAAGLFGQALPGIDASVWNSLPALADGRQVASVKPFTRILAEGVPAAASGASGRFPALLVRRYGQGVVGLVNADGLWKWDFFPEARELGNMYEDFWTQLIQWMASYSEFLPGQDFSLRLPSLHGAPGRPVRLSSSYRGTLPPPAPIIRITPPDGETTDLSPASLPDASGRPHWSAGFTPDQPGTWKISLVDPRENAPPTPTARFDVPAPPSESADLSADPSLLAALADGTGGKLVGLAEFPAFLENAVQPAVPTNLESGAVWKPYWTTPLLALAIAALLGAEWFLRRRQGLA